MKKMFNKRFFLILGSTITLFVVLGILATFLTRNNIKTFTKSGYIIASGIEEGSTKYYFEDDTTYKKNINGQLVFNDTSGDKVSVNTDNFMHYTDGGIRFLKNGVIMDLDSVDEKIVPYYNITNKSVLEYSKKSYYIEANDKTLAFNNLIGRISENKYIVAGTNIKLQLAGNDNLISGDYFEITYIEDGIIRVENQEVSYQTTSQDSYVLVNDNIKIDLGLKKIFNDDEEKMSITELTIDGNENIEIIPNEVEQEQPKEEDNTNVENNDNTENNTTDNTENEGTGTGTEGGSGGSGTTYTRSASVELVSANVGVNSVEAKFSINDPDNSINGNLVARMFNTDTGKEVYSIEIEKGINEYYFSKSSLSPNSNYVLTIDEKTSSGYETQYFQKLFKTDELGISLNKVYITQDSIAYQVDFGTSEVKSVKVSLYDTSDNQIDETITVTSSDDIILFEELDSNTQYTLKLDNIVFNNLEYENVYTINKAVTTLKKTPYISGLTTETDSEDNNFIIGIENVTDEDNSIVKYYYYIYNADDITIDNIDSLTPVMIKEKTDTDTVKINIDNENIFAKTNYKFKVVTEYYDNEKYSEFETELSDNFVLAGKPTLTFEQDYENTLFNKIVGVITINDDNCTVPIQGRSCYSSANNFALEYQVINSNEKKIINNLEFNSSTLEYNLSIDSLLANTEYIFNLYGNVDLLDGRGIREGYLIGTFRASTQGIDILTVDQWVQNDTGIQDLINVSAKIVSTNNNDNIAESLNYLTFNLYSSDVKNSLEAGTSVTPIASKTVSGNLKDEYYNTLFTINSLNTFGITDTEIDGVYVSAINNLKALTNDTLKKYYTIEITDAFDNDYQNKILLENNIFVFKTPAIILLEDELASPTIEADAIYNIDLKYDSIDDKVYDKEYDSNLSDSTIVGYKVYSTVNVDKISSYFEGSNPVRELVYYVCDNDTNSNCTIDNAIVTQTVDLTSTEDTDVVFYLNNGTSYSVTDTTLTRGHNYIFKLKLNIDSNNDGTEDTVYPSGEVKTSIKTTPKQAPTYSVYISKTTESEVYYKYSFTDIDNALYDNKFYYTVDDNEQQVSNMSNNELVIDNLTNDSVYQISFKRALIKNAYGINDVTIGKYMFDGKYTYDSNTITFRNVTYESDNRLRVLILGDEEKTNRVSAYKITLSANGVSDFVRVYPVNHLKTCTVDETDYQCIIIDYADIKDFKAKQTTVNLTAYYDSGIINNDFANLSSNSIGYILQNNNSATSKGKYIHIKEVGNAVTTSDIPYGIYEYGTNSSDYIQLIRKIDINKYIFKNTNVLQTRLTYADDAINIKNSSNNYVSINNKLLSTIEMNTDNAVFKFNSYIPKISVSSTSLVDGATITITPSGIDNDILTNEFKDEDGEYYYYIKIYSDSDKTELVKDEKLAINTDSSSITLSKYLPNTTYYFEVYAYMLKDSEYKETLLFDANTSNDYVTKLYSFSSLPVNGIVSTTSPYASYTSYTDTNNYSNRTLSLYFNTKANIGNYQLRFELYDPNNNLILTDVVEPNYTIGSILGYTISQLDKDISEIESESGLDFVYGSGYYTYKVYMLTDVYNSDEKAELLLYDNLITDIAKLTTPTIDVTKTSGVNSLTFNITITDNDKVITNGTYCVELLDSSNKTITGIDPICNLKVTDVNKEVVFDNLTSDTVYIFRVYADTYMNNVGETETTKVIESRNILSTSTEYGVALGSVAAYGSSSSVTLSFSSGVNINRITKIDYTLMQSGGIEVMSETYIMGVDKNFYTDGDIVRLVIEPSGLNLQRSSSYYIVVNYYVTNNGEYVRLNNKSYQYSIEF